MKDYSTVVTQIKPSVALIITTDSAVKVTGTGSGFVFGKKNILVTCNHVVKGAAGVYVKFPNTELIPAKIVVLDEEHDIALLKFNDDSRIPLSVADFEKIKEGMPVLFAGYPLSMENLTTHQGILSGITKDATGATTYLIDGTVNPGNSGCPLMDENGKVMGVVNATKRERMDLITKVRSMNQGALSLHGVDVVEIYKALIENMQLGIGFAVPASYIPEHKELPNIEPTMEVKQESKKAKI